MAPRRIAALATLVVLASLLAGCRNRFGVEGTIDRVLATEGDVVFSGWVHLPDGVAADQVRAEMVVDGAIVGSAALPAVTLHPRPDVDAAKGGANLGFTASFAHMTGWGGVRLACLPVVPAWAPTDAALRADTWVACPSLPELRTRGSLDRIEVTDGVARASGWTFVPGSSRTPQREWAYLYLDGVRVSVGAGVRLGPRADVEDALSLRVDGVAFDVPVAPGRHDLCLGASTDLGTDLLLQDARVLSCRAFDA